MSDGLMRSVLVNQESNWGSMATMTVRILTSWARTLLLMMGSRWATRFRRSPAVPSVLPGVGFALADEGVTMSYKYRTVRVRGTELVGTIARKHGSAAEIYETSKDPSTSVVPVFFEATGEVRFFDRSVLEDVVAPAS